MCPTDTVTRVVPVRLIDGTPNAWKRARSVWSGGKPGEQSKGYLSLLYLDIETFSGEDLRKAGLYRYCESKDFELLCLGYAVNDEPVKVVDLVHGDTIPLVVIDLLTEGPAICVAHNAAFERVALSRYLGQKLPIHKWRCTEVWSSYCGLPSSLKDVGHVLRLGTQKLNCGEKLIRKFCVPGKDGKRLHTNQYDPDWRSFLAYNVRDVETDRELWKYLSMHPIPDQEWELYHLDQIMNDRGIRADVQFAAAALEMDKQERSRLIRKAQEIGVQNPNSTVQMKKWLAEKGVRISDLTKGTIEQIKGQTSGKVRQMLEIRQCLSKTSTRKYQAVLESVSSDGYLRGVLQFYGAARTGRWTAKRVQVQNLKRNSLPDLEAARSCVLKKEKTTLELLFPSVSEVLSQLVRTVLIPDANCKFLVADFSAIEARVLAYIAQEKWRLEAFANGEDLYCRSASMMWKIPVIKNGENGHLRQKGKIAELALGYGGSEGALRRMGALEMGLEQEELSEMVSRWRHANPAITKLWSTTDQAVKTAVSRLTSVSTTFFTVSCLGAYLTILLPSGRKLFYRNPRLERKGLNGTCFVYDGITTGKGWGPIESYGAKVVENITQAIARDLLAEAMLRLNKAGYDLVFTVHDEIVICNSSVHELDKICQIMCIPPVWAPELVLKAEGYSCDFYMKD